MILEYNSIFWPDSYLESVTAKYESVRIIIHNSLLDKELYIECSKCAGITQMILWDEVIIDNVYLEEIPQGKHELLDKVKEIYPDENDDYGRKYLTDTFYELKIVLLGDISFSVICQSVTFSDTNT